jgi:hypothetical protein
MSRSRLVAPGHAASDAELVAAWRRGEPLAIGELLGRHAGRAAATAAAVTGQPASVDALVDAAAASLVAAIDRGDGPRLAILADLLHRVEALAPIKVPRADERAMITVAFADLPDRWQAALWGTTVDVRSPERLGFDLGIGPAALTALVYRAKEGLVTRYVAAHLTNHAAEAGPGACRSALEQIAAHARGSLDARARRQTDGHLEGCDRCRAVRFDVDAVHEDLRSLLWPSLPDVPGAMSLLAADEERRSPVRRRSAPVALVSTAAAAIVVAIGTWVAVGASGADEPDTDVIANATTVSTTPVTVTPGTTGTAPASTRSASDPLGRTASPLLPAVSTVAPGTVPTLPPPTAGAASAEGGRPRPASRPTSTTAPLPAGGPAASTPPTVQSPTVQPTGTPAPGLPSEAPAIATTTSTTIDSDDGASSATTTGATTTTTPPPDTSVEPTTTSAAPTTTPEPTTTLDPVVTTAVTTVDTAPPPDRVPPYDPGSGEGYLSKPIV